MRSRLKTDGRGPRSRIAATGGHGANLVEDQIIVFARRDLGVRRAQSGKYHNDDSEKLSHGLPTQIKLQRGFATGGDGALRRPRSSIERSRATADAAARCPYQ